MRDIAACTVKGISRLLVVVAATLILSGWGPTTESIRVRVVDDATGKPIGGVVALYQLHASTSHGTSYTQKAIFETVSDANGWIEIPPQSIGFPWTPGLSEPNLLLFGDGYNPEYLSNGYKSFPTWQEVQKFRDNGKTIRLKRPQNLEEYVQKILSVNSHLAFLYTYTNDDPCGWKAFPRAVMALEWQMMQFEVNGRRLYVTTPLRDLLLNEAISGASYAIVRRCGSPTEFFRAYSLPCPDGSGKLQDIQRRTHIDEVSEVGTRATLFTLGYCPSDNQRWLFEENVGWRRTEQHSLDFIKDKRRPK